MTKGNKLKSSDKEFYCRRNLNKKTFDDIKLIEDLNENFLYKIEID